MSLGERFAARLEAIKGQHEEKSARGRKTPVQIMNELREAHSLRGSMGDFYALYPDEAPPGYFDDHGRGDDAAGRGAVAVAVTLFTIHHNKETGR
jgi:hypothetical protein